MHLLAIVSIIYVIYQLIKEALEKPIPGENWENKELQHQDIMNGVPIEQIIKNAKKGRYKYPVKPAEQHHDPKANEKDKK